MNSSTSSSLAPQSIAVVDSAITDIDELLQGITVDHVVTLDSQQDGITQVAQILSQHTHLESVHIFAHGDSASLQLGNSVLNNTTLGRYANALEQWGTALQDSGDILVYGCNVGAGSDGLAFVQQFSQATGADIAASDDLTGQGGDWHLEVSTGTIDAINGVDTSQLQAFDGTLNLVTNGSFEADDLSGTFESIPGWTAASPGDTIEVQRVGSFLAFDGDARVELDSSANGSMVQSIDTEDGITYTLSFAYSPRPQQAADTNGIEVYWNGQLLDTIAEDGTALPVGVLDWNVQSYQVEATGASTDLEFRAVGISDGLGGLLDAVSLDAIVPPPDTSIQFTDVTAFAGVTYTGESHGAAWGDVNGDGLVDLWTTNHNSLPTLYINQGNGTFQEDTSFSPVTNTDTHGSAFADFDNDGDKDLVVVTGSNFGQGTDPNQLYVNENGVFTDRATELGVDYGFARGRTPLWLDYDNDGKLDLIVSSLLRSDGQGLPTIFRQTDNGFEEVKEETGFDILGSRYSLLSDLDQDGRMEVLVNGLDGNFNNGLTIFDTGNTPFTNVTSSVLPDTLRARDIVIADFNGDLRPDIFATRDGRDSGVAQPEAGLAETFLQGTSTEQGIQFSASDDVFFDFLFTFELPLTDIFIGSSGINPTSRQFTLSATDPDNQGILSHTPGTDPGVYVGYDTASGEWQVLLSANTNYRRLVGSVSTAGSLSNLSSIGFDIDETPLTERLLINTAEGFVDQSQAAGITLNPTGGESIVAGDFDNDKDVDVYIVGRNLVGNRPNILYENQGDGTFVEVASAGGAAGTTLGVGESAIVADYDGDGFLDLFTLNGKEPRPFDLDGQNQLFRNLGNDNHWIQLDLEGSVSNRDGIGAQVYVTSGGVTQLREQNGGMHKHSQNHTRLHFGLAQDTIIDEIRIVWPSGIEQVLTNVDINQVLSITESNDGPVPDTEAPTASLTAGDVTAAGATTYDFTVTYSDNEAIATTTLDDTDIQVTGPDGFDQTATLVSVDDSTDGSPRTATYQITTPGGTWDETDNGTYSIALNGNEVSDVNGNDAIATPLGNFTVTIDGDPPVDDGLLQNVGFENGLTDWEPFTGTETVTTTDPFAGTSALQLTTNGSGVSQLLTATAGETYQLNVAARFDGQAWSGTGLTFYDANWNEIDSASVRLTNTSDWTDFELIVTAPTSAAFLTQWIFKGGDTGVLDIDNVILDIATAPPPPAPTNLLDNPGFENNLDNWDIFAGGADISTTDVFNGQQSLELSGNGSGISQVVNVTAGETYSLDVTAKTNASAWSGFGLTFYTEDWVEIESNSLRITTADWSPYMIEETAPANTAFLTVWVFKGGDTGATTVDDFNFERVGDDPPTNEAPVITSDGGGDTATVSIDENTTAVTNVEATDADGDTEGSGLTYSLQGIDASQLVIDPNTGDLSFIAAPDFEAPTDNDGDNQYDVEVVVTDSEGATDTQAMTITVQDVDDTVEPGVVFFDDFETNQGWVVNPNNSDTATTGQWEITNPQQTALNGVVQQLGTTVSGTQALVTDGTAGTSVGSFDVDNGLTSVRSPQIVIPETDDFIRLSFSYYLAHLDNANDDDFLRVTVVGAQTSRVVLLEQGDGTDRAAAWTDFSADISDFAGETITLLVETQDGGTSSLVEAAVDDLTVEVTTDAPPTSFRIEAEDFDTLQNYTPESGSFASGGEFIRVNNSGTATTTFNGISGRYNIVVGYYDEDDGQSQLSIELNNTPLDTWTLNNSPGGDLPNADNLLERTVATNIFLSVGDSIELLGTQNSNEFSRIDYVDFIAVG